MGEVYDKEMLMRKLMSLYFIVHDLSLYLDTHPNDRMALEKHNKYSSEYNETKRIYEEKYGPLTIYTNMNNEWAWIDEPWPWERGAR